LGFERVEYSITRVSRAQRDRANDSCKSGIE
jgi:hypothetical protein